MTDIACVASWLPAVFGLIGAAVGGGVVLGAIWWTES